jgi:hypothetical protein
VLASTASGDVQEYKEKAGGRLTVGVRAVGVVHHVHVADGQLRGRRREQPADGVQVELKLAGHGVGAPRHLV